MSEIILTQDLETVKYLIKQGANIQVDTPPKKVLDSILKSWQMSR
jgi:hypothetical protein